jgi:hypothetical protein
LLTQRCADAGARVRRQIALEEFFKQNPGPCGASHRSQAVFRPN